MHSLNHYLVLIGFGILICALGVSGVRRRFNPESLSENNDFAGYAYCTIGLVYGVILGFVIVIVWESYNAAQSGVVNEVVRISALWRDSHAFPDESRARIHKNLIEYTKSVIEKDWPSMASTFKGSPESNHAYEELWKSYYDLKIDSNDTQGSAFFGESVSQLNELGMQRRSRGLAADSHLPWDLWAFLIGGGFVTVCFTYFIGTRSALAQHLMTATMAASIGFSLYLLVEMEHPFSGRMGVSDEPFVELLQSLQDRDRSGQ